MSITTAMCKSFKQELLGGVHDLDTHTIKVALIKASPSGTYGEDITNYSTLTSNSDEASGTGYDAGGQSLTNPVISLSGSTAIVDFDNATFSTATVSANGCILYNSSQSNKAIAVINFEGTKTSTNGDFTIVFPGGSSPDSTNAIIRIA